MKARGARRRRPRPTRRVSLGRTDHDRRERRRPTQTKPARPAPAARSRKRRTARKMTTENASAKPDLRPREDSSRTLAAPSDRRRYDACASHPVPGTGIIEALTAPAHHRGDTGVPYLRRTCARFALFRNTCASQHRIETTHDNCGQLVCRRYRRRAEQWHGDCSSCVS